MLASFTAFDEHYHRSPTTLTTIILLAHPPAIPPLIR